MNLWFALVASLILSQGPACLIALLTFPSTPAPTPHVGPGVREFDRLMAIQAAESQLRETRLLWISATIGFLLYLLSIWLTLRAFRANSANMRTHAVLASIVIIALAIYTLANLGKPATLMWNGL